MIHKYEKASISYRKVKCNYIRSWWECPDTGEHFVTTEMDEEHLRQIHWYWQSTRTPRKKENKTEKTLRDLRNKYQSWYQQATQSKMGRGNPDFKYETELLAKIEVLEELKNKLK
jgi:hypothetical protein